MKQNFSIYIFLCILFLGSAACQDDLLYNGGEIGEGESLVSATVNFKPLTPALNGHTRAAGNIIKSINSLCVLLYNEEGKLLKTYPLEEAGEGVTTPGEGKYTLNDMDRNGDKKTESIDGENKELPSAESKTPHADFKLKIPYGRYYIYAVANMSDLLTNDSYSNAIQTIEGLKSISLTWDANDIAANNQMFGNFTVTGSEQQDELAIINQPKASLHAWIRRAASKVTIAYDGSDLHENVYIYLKSVTIKDIPTECYLGKESTINKDPNDNIEDYGDLIENGESITYAEGTNYNEQWPARITKGKPFYYYTNKETAPNGVSVWNTDYEKDKAGYAKLAHGEENEALFFYENMQGTGKNKQQDADGNGELDAPGMNNKPEDEFYKDQKPYGTYIEVKAYYVSNVEDRVGSGEITYRFMLGKNTTTDYNAERNHHYKLTLKFNKYANDVDWHIEYEETKPGIEVPNPYYISYLYNRTMNLPVKINTAGGKLISLKAEILTNNWAPYGAYTGQSDQLDYAYWYDYAAVSQEDFNHPYIDKITDDEKNRKFNNPWNGFLSLRKTRATILTTNPIPPNSGESIIKIQDNKSYYEGTGNFAGQHAHRGQRTYVENSTAKHEDDENDGAFTLTENKAEKTVTVSVPLYTRAKQMIISSGYTGNNPYVAYQRRAEVEFTAEIQLDGETTPRIVKEKAEIFQVRRIVNPKGIYRSHDNATPFHVTLMRLPKENALQFESFTSEGPWNAEIVKGSDNFISLSQTEGNTGTPIDFTVSFNGTCAANTSRHAVIRINYHNKTCQHLIFVRQGDAPVALLDGKCLWHTYNLVSADTEAKTPLEEGSLFKFGNLEQPIAASSQVNNNPTQWINITPESFLNPQNGHPDNLTLVDGTTTGWAQITNKSCPATEEEESWTDLDLPNNARVASFDDFRALFSSPDIEQGYGVLYGDDADETLRDLNQVYGVNSKGAHGMRGCFVYNKETCKNLFFPIGASGYGHRKEEEQGILRYSCGRSDRYPEISWGSRGLVERPLFYDLYMRPGATYWLDKLKNGVYDNSGNLGSAIGWDFNYFTFDFNHLTEGNVFKSNNTKSDACFIRCVEGPVSSTNP